MSTEKAVRLFRTWNKREPDRTYQHRINFPDQVPQIGVALRIDYFSSKWSRRCLVCEFDGDEKMDCETPKCPKCGGKTDPAPDVFKLFTHKCESRAPVYAATSKPDSEQYIQVEGGNGGSLVFLAYAAEIEVKYNNGTKHTQGFSFSQDNGTPLYGMVDRKTLLIPWTKRPMIIKGSKMKITAHGIER